MEADFTRGSRGAEGRLRKATRDSLLERFLLQSINKHGRKRKVMQRGSSIDDLTVLKPQLLPLFTNTTIITIVVIIRTAVKDFLLPRSCHLYWLPRQLYLGNGWVDVAVVCVCVGKSKMVRVCARVMEHLSFFFPFFFF